MPGRSGGSGTKDGFAEFVQLVLAYAKQETLDPVVKQAKTVGKGVAGAALLALGTVLLAIGFLRALQTEFGGATGAAGASFAFAPLAHKAYLPRGAGIPVAANAYTYGVGAHLSGDWSWVPYMGGALFCLAVAGFCAFRIFKGTSR
jgi:hypothetical protein